jgi:hypothetical protein
MNVRQIQDVKKERMTEDQKKERTEKKKNVRLE